MLHRPDHIDHRLACFNSDVARQPRHLHCRPVRLIPAERLTMPPSPFATCSTGSTTSTTGSPALMSLATYNGNTFNLNPDVPRQPRHLHRRPVRLIPAERLTMPPSPFATCSTGSTTSTTGSPALMSLATYNGNTFNLNPDVPRQPRHRHRRPVRLIPAECLTMPPSPSRP